MTHLFEFLNQFNYKTHRINFKVVAPVKLPFFHGTSLRGILGDSFLNLIKKVSLPQKERFQFALEQLFIAPLPEFAQKLTKYQYPPKPIIISPSLDAKLIYFPGDFIEFKLTLIGNASEYLPEIMEALENIENLKIGSMKGKMRFYEMNKEDKHKPLIQTPETEFEESDESLLFINFVSPVFFRNKQIYNELSFQKIMVFLYRRLVLQTFLYCDQSIEANELINTFEKDFTEKVFKTISVKLEKHYTVHWSNRSNKRLELESKIGSLVYKGIFTEFIPLLEAGKVSHIGAMTSSGLGQFKFQIK